MRELLRELTVEPVGRRLARAIAIMAGGAVLLGGAGAALRASGGRPSPPRAAPSPSAFARSARLQRVTANPRENHIHRGAISPDGTRLAFGDSRGLHVRTIDPPSTRDLPLAPGEQAQFMSFYPDGVRLMAVVARTGGAELAVFDVESGARRVFPGATVEAQAVPRVSPDGARVALTSGGQRSGGRVAVAPASGGPFQVVAELHGHAFTIAWSPKGRSIAYVEEEEGSPPLLRTVDTATGEKRTLLSDDHLRQETGLSALAWLADGRLVFARAEWLPQEPGTNLYAMPVDDAGRALAEPARVTDWTNLVVGDLTAARTGRIALTRHQMQADVYVGALSDDGRTLGAPRRLTMSDRNERASGFTGDGRTVLLMSDRNGRYDVFQHALTGEDDALVATDAAAWSTWAVAAPDGAMLFWRLATTPQARPAHPLLVRRDLAGARVIYTAPEEEVAGVLGRPPPISRVRCSATSCFLSRFEGDDFVLYEMSPSSGLGREVYRRRRSLPLEWDVSRDGSRVALPIDGRVLELVSTGTGAHEILAIPMYAESVAWLPSGAGLVATGFDASLTMSTVRRVDLVGGAVPLVTQEAVWFAHPQVSHDGATLAYSMKAYDDDLWIVDGL
jgi:Tol biopolymer transport system component